MISSKGFRLGIRCCYCGGRLSIDAASRTTRCDHCASLIKIARDSIAPCYAIRNKCSKREVKFLLDQHLKESGHSLISKWESIEVIYVPYWQVNGTVIHIRTKTAGAVMRYSDFDQDFVDNSPQIEIKIKPRRFSLCADDSFPWEIQSLGIRTQVIELEPLDTELAANGKFAPTTLSQSIAQKRFNQSAASTGKLGAGIDSTCETMSVGVESMLVYFPVWVARYASHQENFIAQSDPLAKRIISVTNVNEMSDDISLPAGGSPVQFKDIKILPHRCPNCGSDLPLRKRSISHYCSNCRRMYIETADSYRQLQLAVPDSVERNHSLFPFWVFSLDKLDDSHKEIFFKALDLVGYNCQKFHVPAFHISNPSKLLRLVSHFNRCKEDVQLGTPEDIRYNFVDVIISPEEASELIVPLTTAAKALKGYKLSENNIGEVLFSGTPTMVWHPFVLEKYFWRDTMTGASIEKAAVKV